MFLLDTLALHGTHTSVSGYDCKCCALAVLGDDVLRGVGLAFASSGTLLCLAIMEVSVPEVVLGAGGSCLGLGLGLGVVLGTGARGSCLAVMVCLVVFPDIRRKNS